MYETSTFALGQIVATPGALELMKAQGIDGLALLSRHVTGDWGDLGEEATRQGIDPHRPATDPVMHTLLTGIVYGRQLVTETEELSDLPPAPGMTPPAQERLRRVAPLTGLLLAA
jgi:hypothetical protein